MLNHQFFKVAHTELTGLTEFIGILILIGKNKISFITAKKLFL